MDEDGQIGIATLCEEIYEIKENLADVLTEIKKVGGHQMNIESMTMESMSRASQLSHGGDDAYSPIRTDHHSLLPTPAHPERSTARHHPGPPDPRRSTQPASHFHNYPHTQQHQRYSHQAEQHNQGVRYDEEEPYEEEEEYHQHHQQQQQQRYSQQHQHQQDVIESEYRCLNCNSQMVHISHLSPTRASSIGRLTNEDRVELQEFDSYRRHKEERATLFAAKKQEILRKERGHQFEAQPRQYYNPRGRTSVRGRSTFVPISELTSITD